MASQSLTLARPGTHDHPHPLQIAIKSGMDGPGRAVGLPSRNITVRGNVHRHGHGISIGSEVSGGVEDVLIEDVQHLGPAKHGLNIKTAAQRGGYIRNVTYRRIEIGQVDVGSPLITLTTSYVEVTAANAPPSAETPADEPLTVISGLRYESIRRAEGYADATSAQRAGSWQCFGDAPCKGVSLADVALDGVAGWSCSHVVGGVARNVTPGGLTECFGSGEA